MEIRTTAVAFLTGKFYSLPDRFKEIYRMKPTHVMLLLRLLWLALATEGASSLLMRTALL